MYIDRSHSHRRSWPLGKELDLVRNSVNRQGAREVMLPSEFFVTEEELK